MNETITESYKNKTRLQYPKLVITGQSRHGKDTACEILQESFDYTFTSSSRFVAKLLFQEFKEKYNYLNIEECFMDRHNHREEWYDFICLYNKDKDKLSKEIFKENDIYCGIRSIEELQALKEAGLANLIIWIDATERLGKTESSSSITISPEDCDVIIRNNGSVIEFKQNLLKFFNGF